MSGWKVEKRLLLPTGTLMIERLRFAVRHDVKEFNDKAIDVVILRTDFIV